LRQEGFRSDLTGNHGVPKTYVLLLSPAVSNSRSNG
jgi:hypothetical protein